MIFSTQHQVRVLFNGMDQIMDYTQHQQVSDFKQTVSEEYNLNPNGFDLYTEGITLKTQSIMSEVLTGVDPEVEVTPSAQVYSTVFLQQAGREVSVKGLENEIANNRGLHLETYLKAGICNPATLGRMLKVAVLHSPNPAEQIEILLKHGVPVDSDLGRGTNLLMMLCQPKYYSVLQEDTILDILNTVIDHCGCKHSILEQRDETNTTVLMYAASSEMDANIRFCHVLLEAGAQVNVSNNKGRTPLMYVASNESRGAMSIAEEFIRRGALTSRTTSGKTDLMYASANETQEAAFVQMFLEATDLSVASNNQTSTLRTPLMYACANEGGNAFDIAKVLLQNPIVFATIDAKNNNGRTALDYAYDNETDGKTIVELLESIGCC